MSVLGKLASAQGRRDEVPNQELARELAEKKNMKGIQEIAKNLWNKDQNIQNDCIKVLYEIGYIHPELIGDYVPDFVRSLSSRNNRLVWGGMTALSTVAEISARDVFRDLDKITKAIENGSVITVDNGIRVLAKVASAKDEYNGKIFPYLIEHLKHCRPKEVAQHAESTLPAVTSRNKKKFLQALNERLDILTAAQSARVKKVIEKVDRI